MTCQCSSAGTSKNVCKHNIVYNRPDLKLKEAEKTIANKDVIIDMLKGQVKKLEQSYINNMKETENFRYKYCLASEQMKRMRCCSEYCYEKVKTKDIPSPLCNRQNIAISAPPTPPRCSTQEALNSEKILKSNKELLQRLNKMEEENKNKTSNEEAENMQREIARLQLENQALVESLNRYKNKDDSTKRDSNVQTIKKDSDAQEIRLSKISSITNEVESVDSRHPSLAMPGDSTKKDSNVQTIKKDSDAQEIRLSKISSITNEVESVDSRHPSLAIPRDSEFSRRVSFFSEKPSRKTSIRDELRNQASRSTQEIIEAAARSMLEKDPSQEVNYTQLDHDSDNDENSFRSDDQASIRNSRSREGSRTSASWANQDTIRDKSIQECQDEESCRFNRASKQIQTRTSEALPDCPCSPIVEEEEETKRAFNPRPSLYTNPGSRIHSFCSEESSSSADNPYRKSGESKRSDATMSSRSDSNQKKMSDVPVTPFNSASYNTLGDEMQEQPQAISEKNQNYERGTSFEKKNCSAPLLRKLGEIKEKIIDMSIKQDTACRELAIVKDKMAITHETTENCKFEISQLKQTVEEQKEEFLARFEENQELTDYLKQSNDEIRSDLEEVKGKIEILFQTVDELKMNQRVGGRQCDARDNSTNWGVSDDDIITVEECHIAIEKDKSTAEVKPPQDLMAVDDWECPPDKKLDCVTNLVNQYKRISKDMSSMCPLIPSCMKVGDDDTESYLDKIREDNMKLKATISSVIEHLSEKMKDMNQAIPPPRDDQSPNLPSTSKRSCQLSVGVSTEVVCKSECATNTNIPIEEIFSASSKCRDLSVSSGSKSPCCCNCDGSQATIEDIYRAVRCSCKRRQRFLKRKCMEGSKCIKSAPSSRASIKTIKSNNGQATSCRCLVGVGKRISREQDSIIHSLENYVTYLHTQLRTISSIEREIEDMRTNIKDPKL